VHLSPPSSRTSDDVTVSFIGAGDYAGSVLAPAFKATGARLRSVAYGGNARGFHTGRKHGFEEVTTDVSSVLADDSVDAVVIATRHETHARFVIDALRAGKHVFVEKPLCIACHELEAIEDTYRSLKEPRLLMIGFNRRFSRPVRKMKQLLGSVHEPKSIIMTVNAGMIPKDHWSRDAAVGGGRIIGEACHFIDLLRHLAGSTITRSSSTALDTPSGDTATSLQMEFADGSIGTVHYFANGNRRFPKERLEVFCSGRILQLDNFRILRGYGWPGFRTLRLWRQDKGQANCAAAFIDTVRGGGAAPIAVEEIFEVSRVTVNLGNPKTLPA
jgi:predicted dehydrogenase